MKRLILFLMAAAMSFTLSAQSAVLDKISKANAAVSTLEATFTQARTIKASGKVIESSGTLYFSDKEKLAMIYDAPSKDLLVINGNDFRMVRGGKSAKYDTSKNQLMRGLSMTLLNCIGGTPSVVAEENNAQIEVSETSDAYIVTLTAAEASRKGYSLIVLNYRKSDCMLVRMQMDEFTGISTVYTIPSLKTGVTIDNSVFGE